MKTLLFRTVLVSTIVAVGLAGYFLWRGSPKSSQEFFESGKTYYNEKKYPEATIQFLNALQKAPRHRDARYLLALSYMNQQEWLRAAQQFKALLEHYSEDVPPRLALGNLYLTGGRNDERFFRQAQEIAQKILAKEPQNVRALILSGNATAGLQ